MTLSILSFVLGVLLFQYSPILPHPIWLLPSFIVGILVFGGQS